MKTFNQQQQEHRQPALRQQQKSWVAVGVGVAGAVTGAVGSAQQAKAAKEAAKAGANSGVDITTLDRQARDLAKRNAADSAALERQFNPEVYNLRKAATESLLPFTGTDNALSSSAQALRTELYGDFTRAGSNPLTRSALLDDAVNSARSQLALGGGLDTATRNEVTRSAAARAGAVGGGGLGLGRDVSARDLGLRSVDLLNSRLNAAAGIAGQDQAFLNNQANFGLQSSSQRMGLAQLLQDLGQQDFNRQFQLAQFGQGIARPETGLDASSLVNLTVGNQNASNAAAQNAAAVRAQSGNALMGLGGNLLGTAVGAYANRPGETVVTKYPTGSSLPAYNGAFNQPPATYTAPTIKY